MTLPKQLKRGRRDDDNSDGIDSNDDGEIKDLLRSLSTKMDSLCGTMTDVDNRLNTKIDGLESSLCKLIGDVKEDMDKKLSSFSADVDERFQSVIASSSRKCEETAAQVSADVSNRMDEMRAMHDFRLDKLERISLEKELIITGVPIETNDNPLGVVGDIVKALNCNLEQRDFTTAFRLKRNGVASSRPVPIVVRVYDNYVKQELLSCYFKRKNLNLKDIGFQTSSRIFINESLTKSNREIFNLASEAKKSNHIAKLFTRNGLVYVQRHDNDKPVCLQHINDLEQLLPQKFALNSSHHMPDSRRWTLNHPNSPVAQLLHNPSHSNNKNVSNNNVKVSPMPNPGPSIASSMDSVNSIIHPGQSLVPPNLS